MKLAQKVSKKDSEKRTQNIYTVRDREGMLLLMERDRWKFSTETNKSFHLRKQ